MRRKPREWLRGLIPAWFLGWTVRAPWSEVRLPLRRLLLAARHVPIGAFALRAHARLGRRLARHPLVLAPFAAVAHDGQLYLGHTWLGIPSQ